MKRYLAYEMKKNVWTFVVLTAIETIIYVVALSITEFFYTNTQGEIMNFSSGIGMIYLLLGIACAVVPVLMYAFKMSKRSVDAFYSLPIRRTKMYLVKTLVGLFLVLAPYTIAYWLGFFTVALRENYFYLVHYVSGYFGGLLFGACIYGICAFAFTRANRIVDGIIFMIAYTFIGVLVVGVLGEICPDLHTANILSDFVSFGCLAALRNNIDCLLKYNELRSYNKWSVSMFLYPIIFAAVSYFLMFFLLRYEKGEDAEQVSDSWFGYKTMIPAYMFLLFGVLSDRSLLLLYTCLIAVGGILTTIVYRRKLLFGWKYWATMGVSLALGLLMNLLIF